MKFTCKSCNYSTDVKFAYQKHLQSKRHNKKEHELTNLLTSTKSLHKVCIERAYICQFCNNNYASASTLSRHKKSCGEKVQMIQDNKYNEIANENIHLRELIKQLQNDNSHLKTLINNAGAVIKTSVSALSYVATNYKDAPSLKKLEDYSYLEFDDDDDDFDLVAMVISQHQDGTLYKYLGDIIINAYKKKDPSEQSIWNSDTVRLTYLIRDIINKKTDWTVDKKGVKTTRYIINPMLKYIKDLLNKYADENGLEHYVSESYMKLKKRTDAMQAVAEIIADITNNILSEQILKFIAPHFYLTKGDNDELIDF